MDAVGADEKVGLEFGPVVECDPDSVGLGQQPSGQPVFDGPAPSNISTRSEMCQESRISLVAGEYGTVGIPALRQLSCDHREFGAEGIGDGCNPPVQHVFGGA